MIRIDPPRLNFRPRWRPDLLLTSVSVRAEAPLHHCLAVNPIAMGIKRLLGLPLLFFLSSCTSLSTMPTMGPPLNQPLSWQQRQQQLTTINQWRIDGQLALRTPEKSGSADYSWRQQQPQTNYQFIVFGVLGVSMLALKSTPHQVELTDSKQQKQISSNAETLITQATGWYIPVNSLYYWIRGLPNPNKTAKTTFDHYHHLATLEQCDWTITYLRYKSVSGRVDLPVLIRAQNIDHTISLKLFIHTWDLIPR